MIRATAEGGEGSHWTLGLNWYLEDGARLMLDYVRWRVRNRIGPHPGHDSGNAPGMRAQWLF